MDLFSFVMEVLRDHSFTSRFSLLLAVIFGLTLGAVNSAKGTTEPGGYAVDELQENTIYPNLEAEVWTSGYIALPTISGYLSGAGSPGYSSMPCQIVNDSFMGILMYGCDSGSVQKYSNNGDYLAQQGSVGASPLSHGNQLIPVPPNDVWASGTNGVGAVVYDPTQWTAGSNVFGELHMIRLQQTAIANSLSVIARLITAFMGGVSGAVAVPIKP